MWTIGKLIDNMSNNFFPGSLPSEEWYFLLSGFDLGERTLILAGKSLVSQYVQEEMGGDFLS